MADNDLFVKDPQETPPQNDDELIKTLVGEGKPYKTLGDLAKGKLQADIHIKRVEGENQQLREKVAGAKTVDDVLAAVKANVASEGDPSDTPEQGQQGSGLTADQVAEIVAKQITGHETSQKRTQNKDRANRAMFELFGDKASEVFAKEANTAELRQALTSLAEIDPEKFISLFKKDAPVTPKVDASGSRNTLNLNSGNTQVVRGTQAFYSNLRKTTPATYWSASTQLEMHEAALRDPDKYFGRT